jgi:hypothetical protein
VPLAPELGDAFDVAVVCQPGAGGPSPTPQAFVTHLRGRDQNGGLSRVNLTAATDLTRIDMGLGPTQAAAWDPGAGRLFVATRFARSAQMPLHWLERDPAGVLVYRTGQEVDLDDLIRGAEPRAIALSRDGHRAFVGLRLYDAASATRTGNRPAGDTGSALAVLDVSEDQTGRPAMKLIRLVFLDRGPSEIRLLSARTAPGDGRPLRELVGISASDGDTVYLYDDEAGAIVNALTLRASGNFALGDQPFGIAVEPRGPGRDRLFVGSFQNHEVTSLEVDLAHPGAVPALRVISGGQP